MQVIFLHHSSFLVEVDEKVFIFDYFPGDDVNGFHFTGKIPTYEKDTPIYWFISHRHLDHFAYANFSYINQYSNITFIVSRDVPLNKRALLKETGLDGLSIEEIKKHTKLVKADKKYKFGDLEVECLRSTEEGVAFYITYAGVSLFHAGDLSDWHHDGVGELINGKMSREYRRIVNKLSKRPINLAFVPMDPRLGSYQDQGIDYFVKHTDAEFIFPMHMWQDYSGIREYKKRISNLGMANRIMEVERENQVFPFGEN